MASPDPVGTPEQVAPPPVGTPDHKASPELSAPSGWQKKVGSSKKGSAPSKRDVFFIAPDGEEIKTKRVLDRYLKSHPGGPAAAEFDWSTGETPTRRSSRLCTKTRPSLDSPKGASAEKRRKKTVKDEQPKDEEKGEEPEASAEVPPASSEKADEVMENVESEAKPVEEVPPAVPSNGQEAEPKVETEQNTSEAVVVEGTQEDKEQKAETSTDNGVDTKEPAKEDLNSHETSTLSPNEESTEHKEGTEKISNVFQHCPEAPNASRQVDVST